jgi:hypothetical protein
MLKNNIKKIHYKFRNFYKNILLLYYTSKVKKIKVIIMYHKYLNKTKNKMKKSILIVSILSISLYSCKKTEIIDSSESTTEVQSSDLNITNYNGNILSFSDRDEFGNLMSDLVTMNDSELLVWENSHSNFISQRKYHEDNGYDLPNEDIVLATVLNKDGIVIIGTKAYLIDIPNDLVYICNEINSNNMALLQNKTLQG